MADYSSYWSYEGSVLASFLPSSLIPPNALPTTTTAPPPPTTVSSTPVVAPTPTAVCYLWDEGWGYTFEVFGISGWATNGGSSLHTQEDGCGALTGWSWTAATSTQDEYVYFNLPFFIKDGCVERAIVSAAGPQISCQGQGLAKRTQAAAMGAPPSYTHQQIKAFEEFYSNATTYYPYVPMVWTRASTTQTLSTITAKPE